MAAFTYIAVDAKGEKHRGTQEAESAAQLRSLLRQRNLSPLRVDATGKRNTTAQQGNTHKLHSKHLADLASQLSIMLKGGMQLEKAIGLLSAQKHNAALSGLLFNIRKRMLEGQSFSQSLAQTGNALPEFFRAVISAGERASNLDAALEYLSRYYRSYLQTVRKIQMSMIYPCIMLAVSLGIVIFLLTFIFDDIVKSFVQSGQTLPALTRGVLHINQFLGTFGWLIPILLLGGIWQARRWYATPAGKEALDRFILRMPLAGYYARILNLSRYLMTLKILRHCGVPLAEALAVAARVVTNSTLRTSLQQANTAVQEGVPLAKALKDTGQLPPMLTDLLSVGEASGELDKVLELSADQYLEEVERRMEMMVKVIEPGIVIVTGAIVLLIVLAIMLPILSLNQLKF